MQAIISMSIVGLNRDIISKSGSNVKIFLKNKTTGKEEIMISPLQAIGVEDACSNEEALEDIRKECHRIVDQVINASKSSLQQG